ncbi:MAG: 30S ribosomal protein S17 [Patescibacteria group bacterium]|nr:30S ribosomal protein S17 [Patescibacteria group bacterium]MDE2589726.1 30S ribosomal protein S17 [Patescibacteria group bacterium]
MKKTFRGTIVSVKQQKTVVVEMFRKTPHPMYRKLLTRSKKVQADSGDMKLAVGDVVKIEETRPLSKTKNFKVVEVVKK